VEPHHRTIETGHFTKTGLCTKSVSPSPTQLTVVTDT